MVTLAAPEKPVAGQRPYHAYGHAETLLYAKDSEIVLSGPAGTGKSRACLEKLHICAAKYAGMRGLILRKTRTSLTQSALKTFEEKVLPEGWRTWLRFHHSDQEYRYPNGSVLVVGGLDQASKIMSTEYDLAFVQEARELTEDDWESITTRLRNGVMPYQQLIGDTNPDSPTHWLKRRADRGQVRLLESRHEDNPTVTADYLSKLDALTGVRLQRFRHGIWAAAEGMVYEDAWDPAVHIIDRFPIPPTWTRYWVVDFGYTNPFVWQCWAEDHDGRLYREWEIYRTHTLVEDHARDILAITGWRLDGGHLVPDRANPTPLPRALICDHDAEDRATLERHLGVPTFGAYKDVSVGIQLVTARLRRAGDGKPRLYYLRGSLCHAPDQDLADARKPTQTEEEFESYVWNTNGGQARGEQPVKEDDHGMDTTRYLCATLDDPRQLSGETVVYEDRVTIGPRL